MLRLLLAVCLCLPIAAQTRDPVADLLNQAYEALRRDDLRSAIAFAEEARRLAPDSVRVLKELGYLYLRQGMRAEAVEVFERALGLVPGDLQTAMQLGYLYADLGNAGRARTLFRQVADGDDPERAAAARQALENLGEAPPTPPQRQAPATPAPVAETPPPIPVPAAQQPPAAPERPELAGLPSAVARLLNQAYEAERRDDLPGAIAYARDARRLAPGSAVVVKELAYLYLQQGLRPEAAEAFERVLELAPEDQQAAMQLAFLSAELGDLARARRLFSAVAAGDDPEQATAATEALGKLAGSPPLGEALAEGYEALRQNELSKAVAAFRRATDLAPDQPEVHKELAYALLRTGETEAGAEALEEAVRLDPEDERAALELAFLEYETGERAESLARFSSLRQAKDPQVRQTAAETASRIEAELDESIARWEGVTAGDPRNRAAQLELADLYERRGRPAEAAARRTIAYPLPGSNPDEILLALARARRAAGQEVAANGALLLASRSDEVRIAETARDRLPDRHPYVSEFKAALALAPGRSALRRELAYLLLEVDDRSEAIEQFEILHRESPDDLGLAAQLGFLYADEQDVERARPLLEKARKTTDPALQQRVEQRLLDMRADLARPHREMGQRSLELSYLPAAVREFQRAFEINPRDYEAAYGLAVAQNMMGEDQRALRWFTVAANSDDPALAAKAQQAYRSLAPQFDVNPVRTSVWIYPLASSRWNTVFGYGQAKTEFHVGGLPVRPYLSLRLAGDVRQRTGGTSPQLLSESALIGAFGLRLPLPQGVTLWGEAGESFSYLHDRPEGVPGAAPDYRGGLNWFRARGPNLGGNEAGFFQETNLDVVYISRFDNNVIAYGQHKPGFRLPTLGWLRMLVYFNLNLTIDSKRLYWANFAEAGPGLRLRVPSVKPPMDFSVDFVRGVHLTNEGNPRRPNYWDLRAAIWYSFSR